MVFQQNFLEKAYFTAKMSGPAIVRPARSGSVGQLGSRELQLPKSD